MANKRQDTYVVRLNRANSNKIRTIIGLTRLNASLVVNKCLEQALPYAYLEPSETIVYDLRFSPQPRKDLLGDE